MNSKFITAITAGRPSIRPEAASSASTALVLACASLSRSAYFFWSRKRNGSAGLRGISSRCQLPSSNRDAKR